MIDRYLNISVVIYKIKIILDYYIATIVFFFFYGRSRIIFVIFFFSSRRRHTRSKRDWSSDVWSSDLRSLHMAPWTFMMRWRSKTTSSVPTILCGAAVVQAASVAATRGISTRLRRSLARRVMSPPRSWGALPSLDLVLHRGNGLQILCDGLQISLRH